MGRRAHLPGAEVVGTLTSAAHGHTLGRPVAMGYVSCAPGASAETLRARPLRDRPGRHARGRRGLAARLARSDRRAAARLKERKPTWGAGNENRNAGRARGHPGGPDHGRRRAAAAPRPRSSTRPTAPIRAGTSTAGPPTPIATRWRSAWPSWRAARVPWRLPRRRRRRRPCSRRWRPAITSWRRSTPTSARGKLLRDTFVPWGWPWTSST